MRSTPTSRLSMFSPFGEMSPTQSHENHLDNVFYAGLRMPSTYAIRIHAEHKKGLTLELPQAEPEWGIVGTDDHVLICRAKSGPQNSPFKSIEEWRVPCAFGSMGECPV